MYRISLWKHWTKLDFCTCYGNSVFCVQRLPFPPERRDPRCGQSVGRCGPSDRRVVSCASQSKLRQYFACFERAWLCRMDRNRALFLAAIFFVWKRAWPALLTIIVAVPGGMLLNELLKLAVHLHRPFLDGWFVDWSGYSFARGHTIGATLLYVQLLLFLLPLMKSKRWQRLSILSAAMLVMLVGFSRIALGAHYLSDVIAAIFLGVLWLMICALLLRPIRRSVVVPVAAAVEELRPATTVTVFDCTVDSAVKS